MLLPATRMYWEVVSVSVGRNSASFRFLRLIASWSLLSSRLLEGSSKMIFRVALKSYRKALLTRR